VGSNQEARTEALDELPIFIEVQDGIEHRVRTRIRAAALGNPDRFAVLIDFDGTGRAPHPSVRQFRPVLYGLVGVRLRVGRLRVCLGACHGGGSAKRKRGGAQKAQNRTQKAQRHCLLHGCLTLNVGSWACTRSYICPRSDRQVIKCGPHFAATISYILCPLTRHINSAILLPVRRERNTRSTRGTRSSYASCASCVPFLLLLISCCRAPTPTQP